MPGSDLSDFVDVKRAGSKMSATRRELRRSRLHRHLTAALVRRGPGAGSRARTTRGFKGVTAARHRAGQQPWKINRL